MDRRDFLTGTVTVLGALMTASCTTRIPLYGNSVMTNDKGKLLLCLGSGRHEAVLRIHDLNDDSFRDFPIPVAPHSYIHSPVNPEEVFFIGFGDTSAVFNLSTGKTRLCRQASGHMFNGHGTLISDDEIWCTENAIGGQVMARPRSTIDLSYSKGKDSFEAGHHIVRLPGTSILVTGGVSFKTRENFVTFYDSAKGEVLRKFTTPYVPVHIIPFSSTEVYMVTNKPVMETLGQSLFQTNIMGRNLNLHAPTPVLSFSLSGETGTYWDENRKNLFSFGLGIKKIPEEKILTAHTWSNTVICWNKGLIEKIISVPHPQAFAVTKDQSQVVVQSADALRIYSLNGLEHIRTIRCGKRIESISAYG